MKIVILFTGGRSGSDLLQSLLDTHQQVLQFPGILHFDKKFSKIFEEILAKKIAEKFIKLNQHFFDSRKNIRERHHQLGIKKKSYYKIDKRLFIKNFIFFYKKTKQTNFDKLVCLHLAYNYKKFNKNINKKFKKKIIFIHLHIFEYFKNFIKVFDDKNIKILITYRDPLASLCSAMKKWLRYKNGTIMTPKNIYSNYQIHFNIFNNLKNYKDKIRIVKLEDLHHNSRNTLKKLSKFINIEFSPVLLKSTFLGKKWWGDAISKNFLNGLNPKFKNSIDQNFFRINVINFLEKKIMPILNKYNYPIRSKNIDNNFFTIFFLFNFEKIFYKIYLKKFNLKLLLISFFYYFKRVFFFIKYKIEPNNLPKAI